MSVMVSFPWTMAPLDQKRLDKTPVPRRACTYIYTYTSICISMYRNHTVVVVVVSIFITIGIVVVASILIATFSIRFNET